MHSKMDENKAFPILKATDWRLLPLPTSVAAATTTALPIGKEEREQIQVGVVEIHPNNQKIVYATRRRSDHGRDLGKELIVVQDITHDVTSSPTTTTSTNQTNPILCSFTLRQLIQHLNQFRESEYLASISDLTNAEEILQGGHMDVITSLTVPLVSVQSLGAVQNLSFLDRGALREVVAPGLVGKDEDEYGRERLLIGFRRCMVVLSVDHDNNDNNNSDSDSNKQQLHIEAFIGPHNVDEYENDIKIQKRQPSSFAIPISEHILAYGCYDGGIRFYDVHKRQQVKACLGPNGRTNPIIKMVHANPATTQQMHRRPRIVSACVSASAWIWELDISVDLPSGEINHFDIPPPLACFDGMVAAVSAWGVPVTFPPPLSPTTRATLSSCSSWDQTDLLQEQFRISYDARQDRLSFTFSPDAIGTSLNPKATRQERMGLNGALVVWDLSNLPLNSWPLPTIAPLCVTSLPRTSNGRVTSDLALPGYCCSSDEFATSALVTLYATSANEITAAITNLSKSTDYCVQKGVSAAVLTDLSTLPSIEDRSGFECHSLSFSGCRIAIGTQHGPLLASVIEDLAGTSSSQPAGATSEYIDTSDVTTATLDGNGNSISDDCAIEEKSLMNVSVSDNQEQLVEKKKSVLNGDGTISVKEGIHRFNQTDSQRKPLVDESPSTSEHALSDPELTSTMEGTDINVVKEELRRALERLEEEHKRNKALETELKAAEKKAESNLRLSAGQSSGMYGDSMKEPRALLGAIDDSTKEELAMQSRISDALSLEESEISSHHQEDDDVSELTGDYIQTMQEENDDLRRQVHELIANKDDVSDVSDDGDLFQKLQREQLHQQLSVAKETEQSLREYIGLLEQNKDEVDVELENARLDAEKARQDVEDLTTDVYEQKLALEEMANLLKEQQQAYAEAISTTKNASEEFQSEQTNSDEVIANLENENARLKEEVKLQTAMSTAMKVELQNALNELAELRRGEQLKIE